MLANLELRNAAAQAARAYLNAQRFLEVETPDLTRSSPEGARDFLVPSRLQPHRFYALPQSPQMFKQILMVAGVDRYYQFARCFRDEDLRADRQPEHTQIDLETSFLTVPEIRELLEGLMTAIFEGVGETPPATPLPRLSYDEAMLRYGSDKPDLRYGLEIVELSETFAASAFKVFRGAVEAGGVVRAIRAPGGGSLSRAQIDKLTELAKEHGAKGMAYVYVEEGRALRGPIVKFLGEAEQTALVERSAASPATWSSSPPTRRSSPPRCSARCASPSSACSRPSRRPAGRCSGSRSSRSSRSTRRPASSPTATTRSACRPRRRCRSSRATRSPRAAPSTTWC